MYKEAPSLLACVAPSKKMVRHLGPKALKKVETESIPGFEKCLYNFIRYFYIPSSFSLLICF
jgi:hypothetical protein